MMNRMDMTEWVNSEASRQNKPPKNGGVFVGNGNVEGVFRDDAVLTSMGREFAISAGSKYCVYGAMYVAAGTRKPKAKSKAAFPETAATIFDEMNGVITIYKDGNVKRRRLQSSPAQASMHRG